MLSKFDFLSTREEKFAQYIRETLHLNAICVCDPTLLLNVKDYDNISVNALLQKPPRYIIAFFVVDEPDMLHIAEKIAKDIGVPLLEIRYYYNKKLHNHNQVTDIGPEKFLSYIKDADFIITNSFHGTIFSIIYNKPFFSFYKNDNSRINNLLLKLGLQKRHLNSVNDAVFYDPIDWERVNLKVDEYKQESINFIHSICSCKNA